jgi:tetratricopeptide (TPR) repeat protein
MKTKTFLSNSLGAVLALSMVHSACADTAKPKPVAIVHDEATTVTGSYLSSQFARSNGNFDSAIRSLRRVREDEPDNMNVAIQLEGMLLLQGQFDEAFTLADTIHASTTKDPLSDLVLTLRAIKDSKPDDAASVLDNAADNGSVQLWVPLVAGWVDLARGKLTKPLTTDSLSADVGRAVPLVNYHLALINAQAGFTDAAALCFKTAAGDPKEAPARIMKMLLKFYNANNQPESLKPLVTAYLADHPEAAAPDNSPSITTVQDGVAEILYTMGGIMFGAGVVNDAAIYLQLAVYTKPDFSEAVVALGDAYAEMQQYARSNEAYGKVDAGNPLYEKAQQHIAVNYDRMGKFPEAIAQLNKMIKANPNDPDALVTKGDLLRIHSRFADAVEAYSLALERIPELKPDHWPILFARGSCLERQGKWADAERDLQQALDLKPDQPDVLNYLGYGLLEHNEKVEEARGMIERAVLARPNDPQIVDSMGWSLYMQGDYKTASGYLEKAVELLPGDPTVNDHLGDVYWRLGRKTEARFQWERALTFSPEVKLAEGIHKKLKTGLPPAPAQVTATSADAPEPATP